MEKDLAHFRLSACKFRTTKLAFYVDTQLEVCMIFIGFIPLCQNQKEC